MNPAMKQSERVRGIVQDKYIRPALEAGKLQLSIRAGDVLKDAEANSDFPRGRTPLVCNVLRSQKLLNASGLLIEKIDGPPSGQSRRVVVHYRVAGSAVKEGTSTEGSSESPSERAERIVSGLQGLLKAELAEYGGAEGFIKWIREDVAPS